MSGSEFLPPDEMSLQAAGEVLSLRLPVHERGVGDTDRTYYDTFDGLIHEAGLYAVHERGRMVLVDRDSGGELVSMRMGQPTQPLLAIDLAEGPLRDALLPVIDVRALLPLAHVHSRVRALDVLDDERKTIVRMSLEEPVLITSGGREKALRPRLRLSVVRGYDSSLESIRRRVQDDLGFRPADQAIVDEAVRAAGGVPGGIPSKVHVPLSGEQRSDAAVCAVLGRLLEIIEANLEGTIADIDSEFLHDFRVSVRRSRAVQRECKGVFAPDELAAFRAEFRWLQQATGDSRDLDVYVLEFDSLRALVPESIRADLDPLLAVLQGRRLTARRAMVRELRDERCKRLLADWGALLEGLVSRGIDDRPDATVAIGELAARRIRRVYRRMVKMGRAIDADSPAKDYHELRKKGKELRYLLELFGAPLFPHDVVRPMIRTLKSMQDVLGRHQDREVQVATLTALRDEVSAHPGGPAALMAMGVLVMHLGEDEQAARGEFAERFSEFASDYQRALVKDTFA
jgi:CHAD domain-containing protein